MSVTQHDVARMAGVSVRTVSNVVNDFPLVANDTRKRVQSAIDKLGYQPNVLARNLRRGNSRLIGLAVPELGVPYFSELAGLIVDEVSRRGYTVVIEQTNGDLKFERELLTVSEGSRLFDALIFSPLALSRVEVRRQARRIPTVFLGEHIEDGPYDHVAIDNVAAAMEATTHLIGLGRRRIAAIGHQRGASGETGKLRTAGYRQALRQCELPFRSELVMLAPSFHRDSGAAAMDKLLALKKPPDAVFCYNDLLAIGAMRTALAKGLRIPEDIAVVGFDDIEEGRYSFPSLTTISPDKRGIAQAAIEQLFARLGEPTRPYVSQLAGYRLAARESSVGR